MDHLKSIIPELKERRLTYDISDRKKPPQPGEYLVSLSKKRDGEWKAGSVYQVVSVRKIEAKKPRLFTRWELKVYRTPDMLEHTIVNVHGWGVWVNGNVAHGIIWHKRSKKK